MTKTRDLSMEVCNLMVEKAPFGVCNDCYTSVVFAQIFPILSKVLRHIIGLFAYLNIL